MPSTAKNSPTKCKTAKQSGKTSQPKKKMGRPRAIISQRQFEECCKLQCTHEEVCNILGISAPTLEKWCKETYGETFFKVFEQKRGLGRMSLRRKQWALAETSAPMAIFLGKNYLGQTDNVETKIEFESDGFLEALKGQVKETFKSAGDVVEE